MQCETPQLVSSNLRKIIGVGLDHGITQSAILQHWLRIQPFLLGGLETADLLRDALVIGLDVEWYEKDSSYITEIGLLILDPRSVNDWSSPWAVLRTMITHHVRIRANAHLINSECCKGYPESFEFGETSFISSQEATAMLRKTFTHFDGSGHLRPIIFVGHAVGNDTKMIKERFALDVEGLGMVVATIDTQVLAMESGLALLGRQKKLRDLLEHFGIKEDYLHNAGNDAVCTMTGAFLMATPSPSKNHRKSYQDLKTTLQKTNRVSYGTLIFCTKCDSEKHIAANCPEILYCEYCANSPARDQIAHTHKSGKCVEMVKDTAKQAELDRSYRTSSYTHAVPCQYCIESPDPQRHSMNCAYGHTKEECVYRQAEPVTFSHPAYSN